MGILTTILVGLIVGALARFLLPGDQKMGWILTCLLGIGGSPAWYQPSPWPTKPATSEPVGWIASVVGAIVLLVVVGKLRAGKSPGS